MTSVCCKCAKTASMLCGCGIVCGECCRGGFLSQQQPGEGSQSSRKFVCPDCTEDITLVELHADVQAEEKCDERRRWCPYKHHGCSLWGTPPEIDVHVHYNNCVGKSVTDLKLVVQRLTHLFQQGVIGEELNKKVNYLMMLFSQLYMQLSQQLSQHKEFEGEELDKKKRDEGSRWCPYKRHGCCFFGTPPEIHEHIQQKYCAGKSVTDLMFLAQQLIQLFQQIEGSEGKKLDKKKHDEGPRWCPYKHHGCSFWGTPSDIDEHVHGNRCSGKRKTDQMFLLKQLNEAGFSDIG